MKRKYTLFATAGNPKSACAFFSSPDGCRNGDNCKFVHESSQPTLNPRRDRSSSIVSSESDGTGDVASNEKLDKLEEPDGNHNERQTSPRKKRSRKNRRGSNGDIFAKPKRSAAEATFKPQHASTGNNPAGSRSTPKVKEDCMRSSQTMQSLTRKDELVLAAKEPSQGFRHLNLPIASFTSPSSDDPGEMVSRAGLPTPRSKEGAKWSQALAKTRSHSRYDSSFDFKKFIAKDQANGTGKETDWIRAKPWGKWCQANPQAIAIDCEMCETTDPATGSVNHSALCRVSVVNAENSSEVLLDTLVKPAWPVTDYRTWVNGIEKEHLENVEFTIQHAQAFLLALCSEETVILGHALHNDLAALKMVHHCNVDSACLFSVKNEPDGTPALKDLTKALLETEMPSTHDSVNDARMALRCLEVWVKQGGDVEPVERTSVKNPVASSQLFIHRVPRICNNEQLVAMFLKQTYVQPINVDNVDYKGQNGKTVATFSSPRHANLAFRTLVGDEQPDASGRLQKKVFLRSGGYIRVRKMVHERKGDHGRGASKKNETV